MRVIITGGTGLIGSALSRRLTGSGDEVVILSRSPAARQVRDGVRYVAWDGLTAAGWGDLVENSAAIVNLAGAGLADQRWSEARKQVLRSSRIDAGRAVAAACAAAGRPPGVVVQASAIGYYGPRGDEELVESDRPGADYLATLCVDWEASSSEVTNTGVRHAVARLGLVFSRNGGTIGKLLPLFRFGLGGRLGSGRQWMSWIHVDDAVGALEFLVRNGSTTGTFNVVAPNAVTNREFTRELGRVLRRPAPWFVPAPALRLLTGEFADSLVTGQRVIPRRLADAGFSFLFPELGPALHQLVG